MKETLTFPTFSGEVIHGKHLGRTIGFPTANIKLPSDCLELGDGTYGLEVLVAGEQHYGIGVYLKSAELFEAHIFDFSREIYGEIISITPLFQIRENQKFSGIDELKTQIEKDKGVMMEWLKIQN